MESPEWIHSDVALEVFNEWQLLECGEDSASIVRPNGPHQECFLGPFHQLPDRRHRVAELKAKFAIWAMANGFFRFPFLHEVLILCSGKHLFRVALFVDRAYEPRIPMLKGSKIISDAVEQNI